MLYFHRFIIIFKLTLQQWFLWLNWTKLKTFVQKMCGFSIPFAFENVYQQLVMKKEHLTIYCFKKSLPSVLKTWQVLISRKKFFWKMSKYRNTVFYDFKSRFLVIFSSNYRHVLVLKIPFPDHIFPKISKYHTENLHFTSTGKYSGHQKVFFWKEQGRVVQAEITSNSSYFLMRLQKFLLLWNLNNSIPFFAVFRTHYN